jgi:hypothetical protein
MKAIDVISDKGVSAVDDVAGKAFSATKEKLLALVRRLNKPPMTLLLKTNHWDHCHLRNLCRQVIEK